MQPLRIMLSVLSASLLAIISCHSDSEPEPAAAEATQGGDDPMYDAPDGTMGPTVQDSAGVPQGGAAYVPSEPAPDLTPAGGTGGTSGSGGTGGMGGTGATGGM